MTPIVLWAASVPLCLCGSLFKRTTLEPQRKTGTRTLPLILGFLTLLAGCGKIGDPLPPIPRAPLTVDQLTASQRGTRVLLSFPLARTSRSIRLGRIEIYRLVESADAPLGITQVDYSARSTVIAEIPGDQVPLTSATISYEDLLPPQTSALASRYRYAVRMVGASGLRAELSNYALITPLIDIAKPPQDIRASVNQNEIAIAWTPPLLNEAGAAPPNVAGYNLYRSTGGQTSRLNPQPIRDSRYLDRSFQFGRKYEYLVRSLSLPQGLSNLSQAIESNDSPAIAVSPKDTFPPGPPDSIKIASINGIVSMFWPSNPESDLAGYLVYRSEDEAAQPDKWIRLTPRVHTPTTFRDDKVVVGRKYFYQISAIDTFGNEGPRSSTVGETINP